MTDPANILPIFHWSDVFLKDTQILLYTNFYATFTHLSCSLTQTETACILAGQMQAKLAWIGVSFIPCTLLGCVDHIFDF